MYPDNSCNTWGSMWLVDELEKPVNKKEYSSTVVVQGVEDARAAAMLDAEGVHFEYVPDFELSNIDRDASLGNQARVADEINGDWVEEYREALRRGDRFPALIVARTGKSKAVNIDGNHRMVAALDEGVERFGAYVVRSRPGSMPFRALAAMANARHGHQAPREERLMHAMWAMENKGLSLEKSAAAQNLPVHTLQRRWSQTKADRRAASVDIRMTDWSSLGTTVRSRLGTISTDEGFRAAVKLTIHAALTIREVEEMLTLLTDAGKSSSKQEKVVRALKKDYAERIKEVQSGLRTSGRGAFTPRKRVALALSSLMALPDDFLDSTVGSWAPEQREEGATQARAAAERLTELADALES